MNNPYKCLHQWFQTLIKTLRFSHASMIHLFGYRNKELPYKQAVGAKGEHLAVRFLKKSGYKILQRNYTCRSGEIDIVCYDHGTIVFVEVKTRYSDTCGPPELSVTETKKRQIIKVAIYYIAEKKIHDIDLRFDVVSILYSPLEKNPKITLFKNAFTKYYDY